MNRLIYRLMYRFTHPGWDTGVTPPEVAQTFAQGDIPPGPALDLGCGTGTNVIYMAQQGHQAFGIDFVPRAIDKATQAARKAGVAGQTRFLVADVTDLGKLGLPGCGFALDMGCFHSLSIEKQRRYAAGLATQLLPGGRYMLYAADPRQEAGFRFGVSRRQVQEVFAPWFEIMRTKPGKFRDGTSTWYWMKPTAPLAPA
jgi:SAM-dependent methyltransferase